MVGLALVSLGVLLYTWVGYPLGVWLLARTRRQPGRPEAATPPVSVILATRESDADIARRVANLRDTASVSYTHLDVYKRQALAPSARDWRRSLTSWA